MTHVVKEFYALELIIQSANLYNAAIMDRLMYSDKVEAVERRTVILLQADKISSPGCNTADETRQIACVKAFAYAAIIHIYLVLHDLPTNLQMFGVVASRLRGVLETSEVHDQLPDLYLWAMIMGEAAAASLQDKIWYAMKLENLCFTRGIHNKQTLRKALQGFVWSESYSESTWPSFMPVDKTS
jgi:hypothetical protein